MSNAGQDIVERLKEDADTAPETRDGLLYRIGMTVYHATCTGVEPHVVRSIGHGWAGWMIGMECGATLPASYLYGTLEAAKRAEAGK